ncbi:MAG: hypothetical protein KDA58_08300 [Planctomycetaceae bacterium]|nr:hypothetical protein [Planctomycetaceae bacterium]
MTHDVSQHGPIESRVADVPATHDDRRVPSTGPQGRRLWRWLIVASLCAVVTVVAYRHRPLNATERQLVGTWRVVGHRDDLGIQMNFRRDRSMKWTWSNGQGTATGNWCVTGDRLKFRSDLLPGVGIWENLKWRWGEMLDTAANSVQIVELDGNRLTYRATDGSEIVLMRDLEAFGSARVLTEETGPTEEQNHELQ